MATDYREKARAQSVHWLIHNGVLIVLSLGGFEILIVQLLVRFSYSMAPAIIVAVSWFLWNLISTPARLERRIRADVEYLQNVLNNERQIQAALEPLEKLYEEGKILLSDADNRDIETWSATVVHAMELIFPHDYSGFLYDSVHLSLGDNRGYSPEEYLRRTLDRLEEAIEEKRKRSKDLQLVDKLNDRPQSSKDKD